MRIGSGYDVHKFGPNRDLVLGGIKIPYSLGLLGHSDADVLVHSMMDSILGALGLGDIGKFFPDTDQNFKNIDSCLLLKKVVDIMKDEGYKVGNMDCTVVAQEPKIAPFVDSMKVKLSNIMEIEVGFLNIKGTTEEKLGFTGRIEGIKASTVVLLERI